MHKVGSSITRSGIRFVIFLAFLVTAILIVGSPPKMYASPAAVGFYSLNSLPPGVTSLEPLLPAWWNWWNAHPPSFNSVGWPQCVKGNTGVLGHNLTVVLLATGSNLASNVNATHQKCEIGANQLAFLNVYNGECSTGEFPGYSIPDLLKCAQDSNKVITKMQVKVDGMDVSSNVIRQSTTQPFMYIVPPVNAFDFKPPVVGTHPSMAETYYLLFKPLPVGNHTIDLEVIRVPQQPNQPVEHDFGHWDLHVVPST